MKLYSDLKSTVRELADCDTTGTIDLHTAMRVLNAVWPAIEALERDRDRLADILTTAYRAAALEQDGEA